MEKTNYIVLAIYCCFANIVEIQSQSTEKYSFAVKGTMNVFADYFFEGLEVNKRNDSRIYTLGYYYGKDCTYPFADEPSEEHHQINLLLGKYNMSKKKRFMFKYQIGVGLFWGLLRTSEFDASNSSFLHNAYFSKKVFTFGFPIKIGGSFILFKFLRIGIDLQANLNFVRPILTSPMLSLEFGKFKK